MSKGMQIMAAVLVVVIALLAGGGSYLKSGKSAVGEQVLDTISGTLSLDGTNIEARAATSVEIRPAAKALLLITPDFNLMRTVVMNDQGIMCNMSGELVFYLGKTRHRLHVAAARAQDVDKEFTVRFMEQDKSAGDYDFPVEPCPFAYTPGP